MKLVSLSEFVIKRVHNIMHLIVNKMNLINSLQFHIITLEYC